MNHEDEKMLDDNLTAILVDLTDSLGYDDREVGHTEAYRSAFERVKGMLRIQKIEAIEEANRLFSMCHGSCLNKDRKFDF